MIEISHLVKKYGSHTAVDDVSLTVEPGRIYGFLGPNGAGKSTLMKVLTGVLSPTAGIIRVNGADMKKYTAKESKEAGIACAYQDLSLCTNLSVYENFAMLNVGHGIFTEHGWRKNAKQETRQLMEQYFPGNHIDVLKLVEHLTLAERQMVEICKTLMTGNLKVLILDEPTGGLDPLIQREFFDILREQNRKGATIFLSSHVLSEIQRNCSRAAIIREGRIIACDKVTALSKTNARRVTVHGSVALKGLEGIRNQTEGDGFVSFLYNGDMNLLLQTLAAGNLTDLSVSEPDLEEIFLHFYEKDGGRA